MIRVTVDTEDEFNALVERESFFSDLPYNYQVGYRNPPMVDANDLGSKGRTVGFGRTFTDGFKLRIPNGVESSSGTSD